MTDPSNFISNPPSTVVKVKGTAREDINGKMGIAIQFDESRGRYLVHMVSTQATMAFKPDNLEKAGMMESTMAQVEHLRKDPAIQREFNKYYSKVQQLLGGLKPEYAAGALLGFFVVGIYFVGLMKSMMAVSLFFLVALIVGPDLVNGLSLRVIAQNFPRRCREALEINLPVLQGRVSDRVAAGIMLVMLGLGVAALFSNGGANAARKAAAETAARAASSAPTVATKQSLEEAYKLGFDDATAGLDFGSSLSKLTKPAGAVLNDDGDPLDFVTNPPPTEKSKSSFGFTQALSLFYIYRMAMDMGRDGAGGPFSVERLIANLKTAGVMKLGILGFSIVNLLRPFLF